MPVRVLLLLLLLLGNNGTGNYCNRNCDSCICHNDNHKVWVSYILICQTYCQGTLSLAPPLPPPPEESGNLDVGNLFPIVLAISTSYCIRNYSDDFSL